MGPQTWDSPERLGDKVSPRIYPRQPNVTSDPLHGALQKTNPPGTTTTTRLPDHAQVQDTTSGTAGIRF